MEGLINWRILYKMTITLSLYYVESGGVNILKYNMELMHCCRYFFAQTSTQHTRYSLSSALCLYCLYYSETLYLIFIFSYILHLLFIHFNIEFCKLIFSVQFLSKLSSRNIYLMFEVIFIWNCCLSMWLHSRNKSELLGGKFQDKWSRNISRNWWCDIMWSELNAILRFDFCVFSAVLCCCSWLSGHQKSKVRNKIKKKYGENCIKMSVLGLWERIYKNKIEKAKGESYLGISQGDKPT